MISSIKKYQDNVILSLIIGGIKDEKSFKENIVFNCTYCFISRYVYHENQILSIFIMIDIKK